MPNLRPLSQWYIIFTCCAMHNFIRINSWSNELFHTWETADLGGGASRNSDGGSAGASISTTARRHVREMCDQAKQAMN